MLLKGPFRQKGLVGEAEIFSAASIYHVFGGARKWLKR